MQADLWHSDRNGRAKARKAIQQSSTHLQFGHLTIEVTCLDALAKELEAAHLRFDETASVIATPVFPYRAPESARRSQDLITRLRARAIRLPGLGISPRGDDGVGLA